MWGERKVVISSDFHVIGRCCLFRYISYCLLSLIILRYSLGEYPRCDLTYFPKKDMLGKSKYSEISLIDFSEYFNKCCMSIMTNWLIQS